MKRMFLLLLISLSFVSSIYSVKAPQEFTAWARLEVDGFISILEEWKRIGVDFQLDSDDNDTSYAWFNWSTNLVKTISRWTFENITDDTKSPLFPQSIGNVTQIHNVSSYWTYRCDSEGEWFRWESYWYNGTAFDNAGGWGTGVSTWHTNYVNLTDVLETGAEVDNTMMYLRNVGAPSWDYPGRISYLYLIVWFSYTEPEYVIPFRSAIGLIGLIMIVLSPSLAIKKSLIEHDYHFLMIAFVIFMFGYTFVLVWLL